MSSDRLAQRWTITAKECYEIGCRCSNCLLYMILGRRCQMKRAVLELVRKFGKPPEDEEKGLSISQQKVINAIIAGCNNKTEIAEYTGLTITNVQTALATMYELAESDGVVYKNLRYKLPDFINWVREGM